MLASQESMLRSQPSEADYRAATVKQRPTSRRITPAEISVSAPTHSTLADNICHYAHLCWHTYKLSLTHHVLKTPGHTQQATTTHIYCMYALPGATKPLGSFTETWKTLKTVFHNMLKSLCFVLLQSLFERQGMTLHGGLHPGMERGHIPLPKGMSRTKSFGKTITHPVNFQIRWMIVYLMYSMLIGNFVAYREYKIRNLHSFFIFNWITVPPKKSI